MAEGEVATEILDAGGVEEALHRLATLIMDGDSAEEA